MKITELFIYPIKSLGPLPVQRARLRRESVENDRRFMLLKVKPDGTYKNIQITYFPECALFHQRIDGNDIVVTYHVPEPPLFTPEAPEQRTELRVPLTPKLDHRGLVDVSVGFSPTVAYRMGYPYDQWFTACFGFEAILVYIGDQGREVLAHKPRDHYLWRQRQPRQQQNGWISSITAAIPSLGVGGGNGSEKKKKNDSDQLTFNDIAPFLVTSRASLRDVSKRLPEGEDMDIRKFRPNIVIDDDDDTISPDGEKKLAAWEEDYWGELSVTRGGTGEEHRLALTANCGRCVSINVDLEKGRPSEGELGIMLKKLMADRRVDEGNKYAPVFGRYAFIAPPKDGVDGDVDDVVEVAVGDEIRVTKRLSYRDEWAWPKY
ncbi:hypothetical protein F5Y08DRAFT_255369 [Xylaria arbuscula]|nr:hypothetical protein F5Y08DRAFT_255369 [Xylaria arbuscula]